MRTWPSESQNIWYSLYLYELTQPSDPLILGGPLILHCCLFLPVDKQIFLNLAALQKARVKSGLVDTMTPPN